MLVMVSIAFYWVPGGSHYPNLFGSLVFIGRVLVERVTSISSFSYHTAGVFISFLGLP